VPFDRETTLRKAEKLFRQGRLDLAIVEYRAVIEDQPTDWNTANTLGDLYFRTGQVDRAIAEYIRIAEHLATEGFLSKAVALYKKILKIKPDEERAMMELGAITASQGLLVEARAQFLTLVERRRERGDRRGEAEARVRLGDLESADLETRLAGARARVELGDAKTAVERLKMVAADLDEKGRQHDVLRLLTEAAQIDPEDTELRRLLVQAYGARGDFEAASQFATSAADLRGVAEELLRQGRDEEGINVLRSAVDADPANHHIRAQLAQLLVTRGDIDGARALLADDVTGSDPNLLWTMAEMELRHGRVVEGTTVLQRILEDNPSRRNAIVELGCSIAADNPEAGYECVDVAARAAIADDEWEAAASGLNALVEILPHNIPALLRLVEICVDGGLEVTMHGAQTQLADAYLLAGAGLEARVIAEDLVAREPWEPANIERFRRALTLLGETDIDAIIAERLSGQSPFTTTDVMWPPKALIDGSRPSHAVPEVEQAVDEPPPPATAVLIPEVDLSEVLRDLRGSLRLPGTAATPIETVLKGFRDEVVKDVSPETAEQHLKLGTAYIEMGLPDEAIKALEVATRSPRHQFRAGALLAKAALDLGDTLRAVEWYERASEAPAPSPEAYYDLLYDLASALEAQGESARALAVLIELQANAGAYRDVSLRLEQLKVQMGSS
jgi:tetratricopeptide (TPR) repeat protein